MSCPSKRQVGVSNNGNAGSLTDVEEVQCTKHAGHASTWHRGILSDMSAIEWQGAPGYDVPALTEGAQS